MPRIVLIMTDLPVPEPPMTTSDWPLGTEMSIPFSTFLGPKALWTSLRTMYPSSSMASVREQERGQGKIRSEDQDRGTHHRVGRRPAHPLRSAFRIEPVIA